MKAFLCFLAIGTVILLGSVTLTVGQNSPNLPAQFHVEVTDVICNDSLHLCDSPFNDCAGTGPFYVPADGDYTLVVDVICADPAKCKTCLACARIVTGTTEVCIQHTTCDSECTNIATCHLLAGTEYKLWVCLRTCYVGNYHYRCAANECNCTAHAKIDG